MFDLRRRSFITLLGGAAAWPLVARAQQGERVRRIGVRIGVNPEFQDHLLAFRQELQKLGWTEGHNLRLDVRGGTTGEDARKDAAELLAVTPDVIVSFGGSLPVAAFQQATRTVPIVFAGVVDPVSAGFVASLARPGGNSTGFTSFEYGISAKWLELLKEIDPRVARAAVLRDPSNPAGIGQMAAMQGAAASLRVELSPIGVRDVVEIEGGIAAFARGSNGGLIVTVGGPTILHRALIQELSIRHRLAAVYPARYFVTGGGLISYGPDNVDVAKRAAGYVDRILKGEKPADLPVQAPTKYELVINLKTAKALGIDVPPMLLARADEVIE
jgi:putative ABC transport system substrate-binding protein